MKTNHTTCRPNSLGFTLIELLVFIILVICVRVVAKLIHDRVGGTSGWVLGVFLGVILFLVGGFACAILKDLTVGGIPRLPKCREGTCRGPGIFSKKDGDYKSQKIGEKYVYICRHGDRYDRRGKRFVIANDDGTEAPYLIWRPFRGWFPDDSTGSISNQHK